MSRNISLRYLLITDSTSVLVLAKMLLPDMSSVVWLVGEMFPTLSAGKTRFSADDEVDQTCRQVKFRNKDSKSQKQLLQVLASLLIKSMSGSLVVSQRVMIFVAFLTQITHKSRRIGFVMIVLHMSSTVGLVTEFFPTFCTNESSIGFDHKVVNSWRKWEGYMYTVYVSRTL